MNSISPCRHCGGSVARDAKNCPHCGSPSPFPKKLADLRPAYFVAKILWILLGILAFFAFLGYFLCPGCQGVAISF